MLGSWKVGMLESWKVGMLESWKLGSWNVGNWKVGKPGPESWKVFVGSLPPKKLCCL